MCIYIRRWWLANIPRIISSCKQISRLLENLVDFHNNNFICKDDIRVDDNPTQNIG